MHDSLCIILFTVHGQVIKIICTIICVTGLVLKYLELLCEYSHL